MRSLPKPHSSYYDHPEGQDIYGKMLATNKYALAAGLGWSTVDILMISRSKGYLPSIGRFLYFTVPLAGMASAFTVGTFLSTKIRNEDDRLNYVIGALGAGGVYGAWKKSILAGFVGCGVLSIAAILKKMSIQQGWEFFPEGKHQQYAARARESIENKKMA